MKLMKRILDGCAMLTWWSWKNQRNILTTSKFLYLKLLQSPVKTACMNFLNWKSSHRFTYAMMLKVDRIRNAANAFSLLYHEVFSKRTTFKEDMLSYLGKLPFTFGLPSWNKVFGSSSSPCRANFISNHIFLAKRRKKCNWNIRVWRKIPTGLGFVQRQNSIGGYKGKISFVSFRLVKDRLIRNNNCWTIFSRVVARGSVYNLHRKYFLDRISETGLHYFARVYFAIRSLSGPQFK